MSICHGCGGVIGRDCFNPIECEQITRSMAAEYQTQPDYQSQIDSLHEQRDKLLEASSALITAIDQQSFFFEGYRNGSASISECNHASDELDKAKSKLFDIIKKAKGNE